MLDKARSKAHGSIEAGFARRLKREVATHRALSGNPFVCKLWGVYEDDKALYIVTELCTGECWPQGCCLGGWQKERLELCMCGDQALCGRVCLVDSFIALT